MCVDSLKAKEFSKEGRLKTHSAIKERATIYTRAYSYSTSMYESLVPVFSEKYDQRSAGYMKSTVVPLEECRFAKFAREQGRNIYVYGRGIRYIEDPQIKYIEHPQTITQMIWSFIVDLEMDPQGLFYMQPVSESHFTFLSPYYTQNDMKNNEESLFFNYVKYKKYSRQYDAAIKYIDDTLAPVLGVIRCKTLLLADHGDYDYEEVEEDHSLISLAELNSIAVSMMKDEKFDYKGKPYVKIGRSAIYNADGKYIFKHIFHCEYRLYAFEGFIFEDGYKLFVFSDGTKELYSTKEERLIENDKLMEDYYKMIETEISVC